MRRRAGLGFALAMGAFAAAVEPIAAGAADTAPIPPAGPRGGPVAVLPAGPNLEAEGWEPYTFRGKAANRFIGHDDGAIEVVSEDAVSALHHRVSVDLAVTPCLSWRWRVDAAMPPTDLRKRGGDDRPIGVYVLYPYRPERASFWESLARVWVELTVGKDAPGRVLGYVWGGIGAPGTARHSPYLRSAGALVLLRPGAQPLERWFEESVDLGADYRRVFGDAPDSPVEVALVADSDDTDSRAHAFVADLRFDSGCRRDSGDG